MRVSFESIFAWIMLNFRALFLTTVNRDVLYSTDLKVKKNGVAHNQQEMRPKNLTGEGV